MAGRNHHILHPHPAQIEEVSAHQHRQIQALLVDNQRLAATHVALKQELAASHQELRHLSATLSTVQAESDAQVRQVYEKTAKAEAEARVVREIKSETERVREDVRRMEEDRRELMAKLEEVEAQRKAAKKEAAVSEEIRKAIDVMRAEVVKGRAAIEYEKKMHATNVGIGQLMDEAMVTMDRDIEKLRAELANAEKMERAAAAGSKSCFRAMSMMVLSMALEQLLILLMAHNRTMYHER